MTTDDSGVRIRAQGTVDGLVQELRDEGATDEVLRVDWDRVDEKLFARLFTENPSIAPTRPSLIRRAWRPLAASLAMAAGLGFLAIHALPEAGQASPVAEAKDIAQVLARSGAFRLNGAAVENGAPMHVDDTLVAESGGAVFARTGVVFALESGARSVIRRGDAHLVVALEEGAIEAQVTPVPMGEAFAVDVGPMRVAVHGTHFRVERVGDSVSVDLTEGIISVAPPSRVGSTYGDLVTAPAHVEFSVADPHPALRVTHEPSSVRRAVTLSVDEAVSHEAAAKTQGPVAAGTVALPVDRESNAPHVRTVSIPAPTKVATVESATSKAAPPPPPVATVGAVVAVVAPETAIQEAVQRCFDARDSSGGIKVSVSSVLEMTIAEDGQVRVATFVPPLPPDLQGCASTSIYAQHFSSPGTRKLPIELHSQ